MYDEAIREKNTLTEEYRKYNNELNHKYEKYDEVLNPRWEEFMEMFVYEFQYLAHDIVAQYDELELRELALDHKNWYGYIEYIICRAIGSCKVLPSDNRQIYPMVMGVESIIKGIKEPVDEPCTELAPIVNCIRRYVLIMNKYLEQYDTRYSYNACVPKQRAYATTLTEWQTIVKPIINMKIEFYKNVCNVVRPVCSFMPSVCIKK
jgi:hypothetical protein